MMEPNIIKRLSETQGVLNGIPRLPELRPVGSRLIPSWNPQAFDLY